MTHTKDEALKLALDAQQIIASLCADKVIDSKEEKILRAATKQARSASPVQDPTDVWFDKCFRSDPPTAQPAPTVVDCHATGVCVQSGLRAEKPAPVPHPVIAGMLFDFMGWLTSREARLTLSSTDDASPAVEAITEFAKMRGLSLDDARVQDWQDGITKGGAA